MPTHATSSSKRRRRNRHPPNLGFSPFLRSLGRLPSAQNHASVPRLLHSLSSSSSSSKTHPPAPKPLLQLPARSRASTLLEPRKGSSFPGATKGALPGRRQYGESSDDSSNDEDSEEEGQVQAEATVQVDFGFFDPKPEDFHGVRLLLRGYLDDKPWDLSGFVDLILEQTTVGTVVKSDDGEEEGNSNKDDEDDGPYAVISVLNLGRYANQKCIKDITGYVLGVCPEDDLKAKFRRLLENSASSVGLLVCERFVNFPLQAVPPLYNGLFDEVSWATEDEPTKELQDSFRFKFYLLITKVYVNKSNGMKRKHGECNDSVIYIKEEDELFRKLSLFSFTFDLQSGNVVPPELKSYRRMGLIMVLESDKICAFRQEVNLYN